ncbi:MAG: hypothetical protein ABR63_02005 [SAR86 cluster bacterium BACL1 MAG-120920-bin57]|jgi:O-6-methylguanine DNA methyltransferase|uniref:methylated-DNA--[protein]-cysteine S-methyltransferase n=1 Tax=SAR86 cluster bacterium BACL1 MAG-120920-bin57 TaxID=1655571 RepID=A0A0R2PUV3_9GAMM|nr:MAG: hypothetical protein ABR63_02005 [SAR86 cluster bacterium BACL1 MAG-120920-bin57]KRO98406.1 MAG: hypothetical protein ABS14_05040 [SAR86 cluster bacterium BACL1 MAG-120813-bin36]KRO98717.1 MAG: hypothetical protein ABS15_07615 [SAR86 cluster bacterium BACL1 MAG-120823-bin87]MDP5037957.1 MGMT family protein [SAR86 cluster bacterium]
MKIKSIKTPIGNFNSFYDGVQLAKLEFLNHEASSHSIDQELQKSINIFFDNTALLEHFPSYALKGTAFQLRVWNALSQIPRGTTESYLSIAKKIGAPRASRAVGTACKHNPIPLFIPCHRVVKHDGSIGEFALGAHNKKYLLEMERK